MTTDPRQQRLLAPEDELRAYEAIVELNLCRLRTWTRLPDERTDWALERLLDELATAALAVRRLRGEADLPF